MRWVPPLVVLGVLCVGSLRAQQQPPPQTPEQPQQPLIFRAGVDVVQVELSIIDEDEKTVHGLTRDQIEVYEDGKKQDIVDLKEIVIDEGEEAPVWARAVAPDVVTNDVADRRLIGIVVDDINCCSIAGSTMTDPVAAREMKAATDYLIDNLGPRDFATVVLTHELAANQPFTGDREALRSVLRRFRPQTDVGCRPAPPYVNFASDLSRMFAVSSQPVKAVVVISSGTGPGPLLPCAPRSYVIPDLGRRVTPSGAAGSSGAAPNTLEALSLPPVPIYYIVTGRPFMMPPPMRPGRLPPRPRPGRIEDVDTVIERIFEQNGSYYLLGFRTSKPTTDGKYRRLEFKIPGHKDYTIRARRGYMRPKPPPKPGSKEARDPELPRLPATVSSLLPASDISLKAAVAAFGVPGSRDNVLVISIDLAHPLEGDVNRGSEELDLRTVVYVGGDAKHDVTTKVSLDVQAGIHRVTGSVPMRVTVPPEKYELWLTARDPRTTRLGSVFYDIEIPDRSTRAVSISGVVIGREPTEFMPVPQLLSGIVPIVPITARTFGTFEDLQAFFQIYQGLDSPVSPVALAIRVLDDKGVAKFSSDETIPAERFNEIRSADYKMKLPLDKLTEGRYLLTIEGRVGGRITPRRDVMFSVR